MSQLATTSARLHANSIPARVIAVSAAAALTSSVAFGQAFTDLGVLDANPRFSQAVAVSGNGLHVAGNSGAGLFGQMRGFRWSQGSGPTDMGTVPDVLYVALGISNDGNTLTGWYQPDGGGRARRAAGLPARIASFSPACPVTMEASLRGSAPMPSSSPAAAMLDRTIARCVGTAPARRRILAYCRAQ